MRKIFLFVFLLCLRQLAHSQYWQQQVNYIIDVTLNDRQHTLDGFEKIAYTNNSPDTLKFIWFHLWPNAYKNDKTAFSDQLLENGNTKFYFSSKEERGYINRLDFKVNGVAAKLEDHPQHIDIVKLVLPKPLPPSQQITITTPFHVKLPYNFSRGGHVGQSYQITQWYPKPAVYDARGWHEMPYLDQGEFYSEFGSFDVRITVPADYVVTATGELQNEGEKQWLLKKTSPPKKETEKKVKVAPKAPAKSSTQKTKTQQKTKTAQVASQTDINKPVATKTLQYIQNNVHDFAWFADKNFIVNQDSCKLSSGKTVNVYIYYTSEEKETWKNSLQYAKDAVRFYSDEVGEYPYNTLSVVQGPQGFAGGMEYPTVTIISSVTTPKELDVVIAHEIGHNWFYGVLGTNEREYPWMDEGINSFYENKYSGLKYGPQEQLEEILFQTKSKQKTDQPIATSADKFSFTNYIAVAYHKTAVWMKLLEEQYGKEAFRKKMQAYFQQWKFRHPSPDDFKLAIDDKNNSDSLFSYLQKKGALPNQQLKGSTILSQLKRHSVENYLRKPTRNAVFISPAFGANGYDRFMIGAMVTNYKLPPSKLQFLAVPLYATGSKQLNAIGKLSYSVYHDKKIRGIELFVNAARFSMNQATDSFGKKHFTRFEKLVPGIKLTFNEKNPRSTVKKYLQWKSFFIREGGFLFGTDTIVNGNDSVFKKTISVVKGNQSINRVEFVYENVRALYPFDFNISIDQIKDLIRPTLTANYFFNYPKGGGLQARLFAGKIFYADGRSQKKTFKTDRFHLNMTGPNGEEDYTYSNYFLGRNKFDGLASQQIMMRDGGFKFRTDLFANEVGKTDRWLAAMNFSTTIPDKINPLSVLPIKLPLRIFADVGTYAEAWDRDTELDRFLYDIGLQLSLFKETINIYAPLIYSNVYKEYYKSYLSEKRFLKTISFSINLNNAFMKKLHHEVDF